MKKNHDIIIIGGGVFGISAAIELAKRGYRIGLLNPDTIPHHLAASTDISKAVRMEYGSDLTYFKMAEKSIGRFHEWNDLFKEDIYQEVGLLMLCRQTLESKAQTFEYESYQNLTKAGYQTRRLDPKVIANQFPAINPEEYIDGIFNPHGGYVKSGRLIEKLADYAGSIGVEIFEGQTAESFVIERGKLQAVKTREGNTYTCEHTVVAAGANTPYLLPELKPYMKTTGHPVFWLRPKDPRSFQYPQLSVFMADISNTGWYGFPYQSEQGVVKIAKHTDGVELHPENDDRHIQDAEVSDMRGFVARSFPALLNAPLVYTRRCLYTDTLDGHFWIDHHPEIKGISVSTGGSGHGMKMAPVLGEITADLVENISNPLLERFRWRQLSKETIQIEEARCVANRKL